MRVAGLLCGGAPVVKKFQIAAAQANAGVPVLQPAAGGAGVALATTTGADNMLGIALDANNDYQTAQQTDNSDPARRVSVVVNPDAIIHARFSGAAADGTQMVLRSTSTANTDGLSVTTGDDWSSPDYDEGSIWGFDGANAGILRKITSTGTTAATVTVAFPVDDAVGDNWLYAPVHPNGQQTVTLTTALQEVRQDVAAATNTAALRCYDLIANDNGHEGRLNSAGLFISGNHVYGGVLT